MAKMSKATKAERYDSIVSERDLWREVSWCLLNDRKPDFVEEFEHDGDRYEFRLYGAMRAHGGLLVRVFHCEGQSNATDASYFEAWVRSVDKIPYGTDGDTKTKIAAERLSIARRRLYDAERERGNLPGEVV